LVHVDTATSRIWWTVLQTDARFQEALANAKGNGQETFTAVLPLGNTMPQGNEELLASVVDAHGPMLLAQLRRLLPGELLCIGADLEHLDRAAVDLGLHMEDAQSRAIESRIKDGAYDSAMAQARLVLKSPALTPAARFSAGEQLIRADSLKSAKAPLEERSSETQRSQMVAVEMLASVRSHGAPRHLRKAGRVLLRCLRLQALSEQTWGLFLSSRVHASSRDPLARAVNRALRNAALMRISAAVLKVQSSVQLMVSGGGLAMTPSLMPYIGRAFAPLILELREEATGGGARQLTEWLEALAHIGVQAAVAQASWHGVALCATQVMLLADIGDKASIAAKADRARAAATQIEDESIRKDLLEYVARWQEGAGAEPPEGPSIDQERDMIRAILKG
jgi:hypothetical protein